MTTVEHVRTLALGLPRSYEVLVHDRLKFRVGRLVYLAFSRDETKLGFAFPKEERDALVAADPTRFSLPAPSDLRFNWAVLRVGAVDDDEVRELVVDAWRMVVPKRLARDHLGGD
ncbi:MAG: MmcQ/YjbR family DNA-binding protein [Acidimicrobiia bacterium]|nr:MmcQ/YjbR family DNA-binding protein [Acidimicrobiia bacterium]